MSLFRIISGAVQSRTWVQQNLLQSSPAVVNGEFGISVAMSKDGSTLVVGSPCRDDVTLGAAYVFSRSGSNWSFQQKLMPTGNASARFGISVALSSDGNTCAVGDRRSSSASGAGAVFVFTRTGTAWSSSTKIDSPDGAGGDLFGASVSLSADGNTCAVGAYAASYNGVTGNGAAYVFFRSGSTWGLQQKITASPTNSYGWSVTLSSDGNMCAVGAPGEVALTQTLVGATYVWTRSGTVWSQHSKIMSGYTDGIAQFGDCISLSSDGNICAISASRESSPGPSGAVSEGGIVWVYRRNGTSWVNEAYLYSPTPGVGDRFGRGTSISGDGKTLIVGSPFEDYNSQVDSGSAYMFAKNDAGVWEFKQKLAASTPAASDSFGYQVSMSEDGGKVVFGAYQASISGTSGAGVAYTFVR